MAVDWAIPHWRQRGRQTTTRARSIGAILAPEMASSTKLSRLPVANHVCLGSWMADICLEGHSLRSASQRRHTAYLRLYPLTHPGDRVARTREVHKLHSPPGQCVYQAPSRLSSLDLGRAQNAQPIWVCAHVEHPRT